MDRIFAPLNADHPLVTDGTECPICKHPFHCGERTMILASDSPLPATVQGVVVHATCGLHGVRTQKGEIDRIKDGDASPFPVVTTDGKQWKFEEVGLHGR